MTYTFTPHNLRFLQRLFEHERFDVIHQQNHIFDTILSSARLAAHYQLPLVLTIHTQVQHPNPLLNRILMLLDRLSRRVILQNACAVVSPDPVTKKYVGTRHGIVSLIIPYGFEESRTSPADVQELRQDLGVDGGPVILSLGHVNLLRNREDVIRAMPLVLQEFPDSRLLIVGEVCVHEPVELVKRLGLDKNVIFTGSIPRNRIPALFALSHLEAHTINSQYPGPGLASLEAMAAGLPVVTGEMSTQCDLSHFRNWENVVMVPPNHPEAMAAAIIRLLSDTNLRQRIGASARQMMANHYSWDAVCTAYVTLYRQVIGQHRPRKDN
jgi:glycosyltransferase involved in cell wall biosynthesis